VSLAGPGAVSVFDLSHNGWLGVSYSISCWELARVAVIGLVVDCAFTVAYACCVPSMAWTMLLDNDEFLSLIGLYYVVLLWFGQCAYLCLLR
jgi:hypothetical protein